MTDLANWLAGIGLGKYVRTFAEQEIDLQLLPPLTEADVRELGQRAMSRRGPRG